jgi:C4-type Zn-finger protein
MDGVDTKPEKLKECPMQCPRCQGTMIVDHFVYIATSGEIWMPGWRCLMCGEIIDPIIENHRQQQQHHQEIVGAISGSSARPPAPVAVNPRKASRRQSS